MLIDRELHGKMSYPALLRSTPVALVEHIPEQLCRISDAHGAEMSGLW